MVRGFLMPNIKVTVMIPTFNHSAYIVRAIKSALAQTYKNIEVLISDDCSSDDTEGTVRNLIENLKDERLFYRKNNNNLGILRNYHETLLRATGDFVVNLDGDDFFVNPSFIERAISQFLSDPEVVLVFGDYSEFIQSTGESLSITNKRLPNVIDGCQFLDLFADGKITWNHNAIVYKRLPATNLGFYWHPEILRNDWESFFRLIAGCRVGYSGSIESAWVQHGNNETRKPKLQKYMNNYAMIDGVVLYIKPIYGSSYAKKWQHKMYALITKSSSVGFLVNRDILGWLRFLKALSMIDRLLVARTIFDPRLLLRLLLSLNPRFYLFTKKLFRSIVK